MRATVFFAATALLFAGVAGYAVVYARGARRYLDAVARHDPPVERTTHATAEPPHMNSHRDRLVENSPMTGRSTLS